jgi:effector-binding domain-containing protein
MMMMMMSYHSDLSKVRTILHLPSAIYMRIYHSLSYPYGDVGN